MSERDDERTVVKTYVPRYQKERWIAHADEMGMSQSEFLRAMVQAGRRGFALDGSNDPDEEVESDTIGDSTDQSEDSTTPLRDTLLTILEADGYMTWEELVEATIGDVESQLDSELADLQSEGLVQYSGRNGGYTRAEDE